MHVCINKYCRHRHLVQSACLEIKLWTLKKKKKNWNVPRVKGQDWYRWHTRARMKSL